MMRGFVWTVSLGILLAAGTATAEGADVYFSDVRIAMELQEGSLLVKEMFSLMPSHAFEVANSQGIVVPVPQDAEGADLPEDAPPDGISMTEGGVRVDGVIPKSGRQFGVLFLLPIKKGTVDLRQSLGLEVKLAHAALVGDVRDAELSGNGFGQSDGGKTPTGVPARFIAGKDFKDGRIQISVSGLGNSFIYPLTVGVTILSFVLLAAGLMIWTKCRISKDADFV